MESDVTARRSNIPSALQDDDNDDARRERRLLMRLLDALDDAIFVVDARGVLAFRNVRATALLSRELVHLDPEGRLAFPDARATRWLARVQRGLVALPAARALEHEPHRLPRASVFVDRLDEDHLVLWVRTADPLPWRARHWVAETFGLSGAEARLIVGLAEGLTPPDAAERFGVALGTVRVQLRSVFAKLGVRRQSEVVARVMRLVPPLRSL